LDSRQPTEERLRRGVALPQGPADISRHVIVTTASCVLRTAAIRNSQFALAFFATPR